MPRVRCVEPVEDQGLVAVPALLRNVTLIAFTSLSTQEQILPKSRSEIRRQRSNWGHCITVLPFKLFNLNYPIEYHMQTSIHSFPVRAVTFHETVTLLILLRIPLGWEIPFDGT